uniref:Receptor-binding cancer antigen expressed on SiSo cells n=1 Tax=Arion vulgaris TaxID=1028688 RepID=A0A0B7A690_9EUPU
MLKVVWNILKFVIGSVLSIFRPLRRLICQRRKSSESDGAELTSIGTGGLLLDTPLACPEDVEGTQIELESWDTWDLQSQTGSGYKATGNYPDQQLAQYNTHARGDAQMNGVGLKPPQGYNYNKKDAQLTENEPDVNYFEDMTPQVRRQPKILIRKKDATLTTSSSQSFTNRLAVMSDVPFTNSELEAWQDEANAWDTEEASEDLTWQAEETIKENKRKERMERHVEQQKKKQKKDEMRGVKIGSLATRLS